MRMKTLWMHLPAPRCFRPLQRTIHLGCRTRSRTIFKHFIFNSLILPRKETSMPSVIANGTQTSLLHGGLQLDFADALCESLSTRTQHKKHRKTTDLLPRVSSCLSYVIHAGVATCQRYALERCHALQHGITGTLHFLIQEAGSFRLPLVMFPLLPHM